MFELFAVLAAHVLLAVVAAHVIALAPLKRPQQPSVGQNKGDIEQVKCRAPGLSDHASPIRQTEARAKRTLERTPIKTSLRKGAGGKASPPLLPTPRGQEWDDKGKALGVEKKATANGRHSSS